MWNELRLHLEPLVLHIKRLRSQNFTGYSYNRCLTSHTIFHTLPPWSYILNFLLLLYQRHSSSTVRHTFPLQTSIKPPGWYDMVQKDYREESPFIENKTSTKKTTATIQKSVRIECNVGSIHNVEMARNSSANNDIITFHEPIRWAHLITLKCSK